MEKIPTLLVRDENDRRCVTREVTPGCEWVLAGEGVGTRKYDGTCTMFDGEHWWYRREVKKGKSKPPNYIELGYDPITEKRVGWAPIADSPFYKFFNEAVADWMTSVTLSGPVGTYELCGPKINGNPEQFARHFLIKHSLAPGLLPGPATVDEIRYVVGHFKRCEGIVWHHPDGRMAKLKRRDIPTTN